jgi:hypothetical protein
MKKIKVFLSALMLLLAITAFAQQQTNKDEYQQVSGHLKFKGYMVSLQNIKSTETKTDTLKNDQYFQPANDLCI